MIDTLAKRAAALHSGFINATLTPSGSIGQIERGYTLGLYTYTYTAPEANNNILLISAMSTIRAS